MITWGEALRKCVNTGKRADAYARPSWKRIITRQEIAPRVRSRVVPEPVMTRERVEPRVTEKIQSNSVRKC